jgi:hypothetical protein
MQASAGYCIVQFFAAIVAKKSNCKYKKNHDLQQLRVHQQDSCNKQQAKLSTNCKE